jgi:enoyl-CoA hydratase/carnithine racemase
MKVIFEKKGPVAYVTINRPERLNACDFETYTRLADIWSEFRYDSNLRLSRRMILLIASSARRLRI